MRDMSARMDFFMPPELARLLADAARQRMMSKADYARQAILAQLERDKVRPR